eukprot:m.20373 g.20373  ORF g.20373 m.20373 type:complete len:831 (-) comp12916_c0_seq1:104-2596(-)
MAQPSMVVRQDMSYLFDQQDLPAEGSTDAKPIMPIIDPSSLKLASDTVRSDMLEIRGAECDRYIVAFHRLTSGDNVFHPKKVQHKKNESPFVDIEDRVGRVEFRRLVGCHGGGGGTKFDRDQLKQYVESGKQLSKRPVMMAKAQFDTGVTLDADQDPGKTGHATSQQMFGTQGDNHWPNVQPNTTQELLKEDETFLGHNYCWHAQAPFFLWHRPLMLEFERLLQDYDLLFPGTHDGSNAAAAHYFKWDQWDGNALPLYLSSATYTFQTSVFEGFGYKKGHSISNPLYRSYAPVSSADQLEERFPSELNDSTCTTREPAYADPSLPHSAGCAWPLKSTNTNINRPFSSSQSAIAKSTSVPDSVRSSILNSDWLSFCTVDHGANTESLEFAHNKFHNRTGGKSIQPEGSDGTMSTQQSPFDPIFWLHHSNIERLLMSWQRIYVPGGNPESAISPDSNPRAVLTSDDPNNKDWLWNQRMYPWLKPKFADDAKQRWWNTQPDMTADYQQSKTTVKDATFGDWWDFTQLNYEYDSYLRPLVDWGHRHMHIGRPRKVILTVKTPKGGGGDYTLMLNGHQIAEQSMLTGGARGTCVACNKKTRMRLQFDVTHILAPNDANSRANAVEIVLPDGKTRWKKQTPDSSGWTDLSIAYVNARPSQRRVREKIEDSLKKQGTSFVKHHTRFTPSDLVVTSWNDDEVGNGLLAQLDLQKLNLSELKSKAQVANVVIAVTDIDVPGEPVLLATTHRREPTLSPTLRGLFEVAEKQQIADSSLWFFVDRDAIDAKGKLDKTVLEAIEEQIRLYIPSVEASSTASSKRVKLGSDTSSSSSKRAKKH